MSKYRQFIFADYQFSETTKQLVLTYKLDEAIAFQEKYTFDFEPRTGFDRAALDRAIQSLFFMAGVSYYKTYLPPEIIVNKGKLDGETAEFLAKIYQKGLGEFFYINQLDPRTAIKFPVNSAKIEPVPLNLEAGQLVGIGGGKDSLVSVELLRNQPRVATWSLSHRKQVEPLVKEIGLDHFWVDRQWDPALLEYNKQGAYNGHVPLSAILASAGVIVAILAGYQDVVVSNESSASEPNLDYRGVPINHQYSKSLEFERDFQANLGRQFSVGPRYYSFLRPLSEVRISEFFAKNGFEKYKDVFSSCNRAFIHSSNEMSWCGECPKCAFVFLALTPFIPRDKLEKLWGEKNLLLDPSLEETYKQLLGIAGNKPMECVGEVKESRAAMRLAQDQYPELKKYVFQLPGDYDYRALGPHSMPADIQKLFTESLSP